MGGSKWQEDNARHEMPADREALLAWLRAETRRAMATVGFGQAIEDALEESEGWAGYKALRASASKRVQTELDFNFYLVHTGRKS